MSTEFVDFAKQPIHRQKNDIKTNENTQQNENNSHLDFLHALHFQPQKNFSFLSRLVLSTHSIHSEYSEKFANSTKFIKLASNNNLSRCFRIAIRLSIMSLLFPFTANALSATTANMIAGMAPYLVLLDGPPDGGGNPTQGTKFIRRCLIHDVPTKTSIINSFFMMNLTS